MVNLYKKRYWFIWGALFVMSLQSFQGRRTFLLPRSQSVDAARELMGWQREINLFDKGTYWTLAFTPEYQHSFNPCAISNYLLGGNLFNFTGSQVTNRAATDILADYFGLPSNFSSVVGFCPRITNFIFDINFYMGFDVLCSGLYFRIHAPIVHAKADLRLSERIRNPGSTFFPAGYMGPERVESDDLVHSVEQAMEGTNIIEGQPVPLVFGDMKSPLQFGKIFGREARTHMSDVHLVFGWNFLQDCWYHLGLNLRAILPTGNRPCSEFLLEAVIGNGKHWEFGLGLTSHVDIWESDSELWSCALYFDANLTHLVTSEQLRSYDFKDNPGSRYMLLEQIHPGSENLFLGIAGPPAPNQYAGHLLPAINVTTLSSNISIPAQFDAVLKCSFFRCSWEIDFGYNLWIRSAEKLSCRRQFPQNIYALKGDAQVYGFAVDETPIALNATEHAATIHGGQGATNFVAGVEYTNANVDSPIVARDPGVLTQLNAADSAELGIAQLPVNTSNPAQLLNDNNIDTCSGLAPKAVTHKLFVYAGNRWEGCECVEPYLGFGGEIEFAAGSTCYPACKKDRFALNQWAVLVKGGFSY